MNSYELKEYEMFKNRFKKSNDIIAEELPIGTLLYGYNTDRQTYHLYNELIDNHNQLTIVVYEYNNVVLFTQSGKSLSIDSVIPNKRTYTDRTSLAFLKYIYEKFQNEPVLTGEPSKDDDFSDKEILFFAPLIKDMFTTASVYKEYENKLSELSKYALNELHDSDAYVHLLDPLFDDFYYYLNNLSFDEFYDKFIFDINYINLPTFKMNQALNKLKHIFHDASLCHYQNKLLVKEISNEFRENSLQSFLKSIDEVFVCVEDEVLSDKNKDLLKEVQNIVLENQNKLISLFNEYFDKLVELQASEIKK